MELKNYQYNSLTYFLIRASFVGLCVNNLLETALQDSWISIFIGLIIGIIPFFLYQKINIESKWFLYPIIVFLLFYNAFILWNLTNFIQSQYLFLTPKYIISLSFLLAIFFLLTKGIKTIGRVGTILFCISIFLFLITVLGLYKECNLNNIKPFLEHGFLPVFKGAFNYIGYAITPLFLLSSTNASKKKNFSFYIIGNITLLITLFIIIANYGIKMSLLFNNIEFHVLKRISFAPFLERLEHFIFIEWILDIFMFLTVSFYFIISKTKKSSTILLAIVFVLSITIFNDDLMVNTLISYLPIASILFLFILPLMHYLSHYNNNKNNNNCCCNK